MEKNFLMKTCKNIMNIFSILIEMENQLNCMLAFDLKSFYTVDGVPYATWLYLGSKLKVEGSRDSRNEEVKLCLDHAKLFHGASPWFKLIFDFKLEFFEAEKELIFEEAIG